MEHCPAAGLDVGHPSHCNTSVSAIYTAHCTAVIVMLPHLVSGWMVAQRVLEEQEGTMVKYNLADTEADTATL